MITLNIEHAAAARIALNNRAVELRRFAAFLGEGEPGGGRHEWDAEAMRALADVCQAAAEDIERQLMEGSR